MERLTTQAWKRRAEWPLTVAAVAFLVSYSVEVLVPGLPRGVRLGLRVVDLLTWALFVVDYVVQVALAPQRRRHVLRHVPDLLVVLLPLLRPLRLLRLLPSSSSTPARSPGWTPSATPRAARSRPSARRCGGR